MGQAVGFTPFLQHHLLAHTPARRTSTVLGDVRIEVLFGSCHLEGGERTPWVACGQRGGAGGNLSKPFCRVSEPSGCWYHILLHGTPCVPGAAAAGERKLAARRSRLTQRSAEHRKQLTRGEGLVATCLFLSCCVGLFFFFFPLLLLVFPPRRRESRSFLSTSRSCRSCCVIDLQRGCCGCRLGWVFPTVSLGLFKDVNSSCRPGLAVRYVNRRSP